MAGQIGTLQILVEGHASCGRFVAAYFPDGTDNFVILCGCKQAHASPARAILCRYVRVSLREVEIEFDGDWDAYLEAERQAGILSEDQTGTLNATDGRLYGFVPFSPEGEDPDKSAG